VRVNNPRGLHARAGVYLSRLIARYEVEVTLSTRGLEADARKAAAILLLGAGPGDAIAVTCRGRQASEAWAALEHYFASDFLAAEKDEP
jgi:phosphotransferase system HPr (HPr) family protein